MTQYVSEYAETIFKSSNMTNNIYFEELGNGRMSLDTFRKTQVQFFFAVDFFSRPMSALIARIPDPKARLSILNNIVEEHGEMMEEKFHSHTFKVFLKSIGIENLNYSTIVIWPQVRAFNSIMATACVLDEIEVGISCLGIIERAFADISHVIAQAIIKNNWLKPDELTHYKLHSQLDIKHANDFFNILEANWHSPEKQHFIKQGVHLGIYAFDRLYRDLISYQVD